MKQRNGMRSVASILSIGTLFTVGALMGCAGGMKFVATPSVMQQNAQVEVQEAERDDDSFKAKLIVRNAGPMPLMLRHSGIQLRLQDGRLLPNKEDEDDTTTVKPGEKEDFEVSFEQQGGMKAVYGATLIIGGVTSTIDLSPKVIGEVTLTAAAR